MKQFQNKVVVCLGDIRQLPPVIEGVCILQNGKCKRVFDSLICIPTTSFDEKVFPIYRRRKQDDLRIVPNVKEIVIDWDGR